MHLPSLLKILPHIQALWNHVLCFHRCSHFSCMIACLHVLKLTFSAHRCFGSMFSRRSRYSNQESLEQQNLQKGGLLEWPTGCSPANSAMAAWEKKVQEPSSCSVHEAACLCWSSVSPEIQKTWAPMPVKEWLANKASGSTQEQKLPSSTSLYRIPAKVMAQTKGPCLPSSRYRLEVNLPTSN